MTRRVVRRDRRRTRRDPVDSYILALARQVERYRPIDAGDVPLATRLTGEAMLRHERDDLRFDQLTLKWFSASERQLTREEMLGPDGRTLLSLNGGCTTRIGGRVSESEPTVVWCRSDLTPDFGREGRRPRSATRVQLMQEQAGAVPRWLDGGEKDARAYARRLTPVARELARQKG